MKMLHPIPFFLAMILLAGCQTASNSDAGDRSSAVTTTAGESKSRFIIEYDESLPVDRPARYNTIDNELDRFNYLEQNFETVLRKELSGYDLDFQLYPASAPGNATVLELTLLSMDSPSPIELEMRMWVILRQGDSKKDLGIIRTRIVPQQPMTQSSIDRDLDAIFTDAAKEVLKKISAEL